MRRIAIYGGSFDPPHTGHKLLAENLAKECNADMVYIIPAATSPFKNGTNASAEERLEMCKLCFSSELFTVSDIEIKRGGKSYTIDTVKAVRDLHPESELFLFMGDDMLLSFHKWYKFREILELCRIVTACRTENLEKLEEMQSFADESLGGKDKVIISSCVPVEISSTLIRESVKNGDYINLSPEVCRYIRARGLYK